jgi:hypothetical protein
MLALINKGKEKEFFSDPVVWVGDGCCVSFLFGYGKVLVSHYLNELIGTYTLREHSATAIIVPKKVT